MLAMQHLYAILDAEMCARRGLELLAVAEAWCDAGVRLLQYRDKRGSDAQVLHNARELRAVFAGHEAMLILNDRVHLFGSSELHGVHVGQGDMPVPVVRRLIGSDAMLGISTHSAQQICEATALDVDYLAIGPVYQTGTKIDAEPPVGLDGIRTARSLTARPLVAIGGIALPQASVVRAAGADSVALISALLPADVDGAKGVKKLAQDFLLALQ